MLRSSFLVLVLRFSWSFLVVRLGLGLSAHLGDSDARLHVAFAHLDLWDIHGEDESVSALSLGFDIPL